MYQPTNNRIVVVVMKATKLKKMDVIGSCGKKTILILVAYVTEKVFSASGSNSLGQLKPPLGNTSLSKTGPWLSLGIHVQLQFIPL